MALIELSNEQRREMVDMQQLFDGWRSTQHEFRHSYRGRMRWRKVGGHEYLYRIEGSAGKVERSLGRRTPETEKLFEDYQAARARVKRRVTNLGKKLQSRSKINRALGLGQMPRIAASILRKIDEAGLLGTHLLVVGTHALYGYAAKAGVIFQGDLTATSDVDLMFDARRRLSLAVAPDIGASGFIGLLRQVDPTFSHKRGEYRAMNDDGYFVDMIRPVERDEMHRTIKGITDNDIVPVAILGLQWLMNAPRFETMAIADDGLPVQIASIDPRVYAVYKQWLATKVADREPLKRQRDRAQAMAVAHVARDYLGLQFRSKDLSALPIDLVRAAEALT